jgi:hypothetical protein
MLFIASLLGMLFLTAPPGAAAQAEQVWTVAVGVGQDGGPCKAAAAALILSREPGMPVAEFTVPLASSALGIEMHRWRIRIPEPGDYSLHAELTRCDGDSFRTHSLPLTIQESEETRIIHLLGDGDDKSWQFEYFGVVTEDSGHDIMSVASANPITLKNISSKPITPCRMMLGAQVQVLELVGESWEGGMGYRFPDTLDVLQPGSTVTLESPRARIIRAKSGDEPPPTAYVLQVSVLPGQDSYQHLVPPKHPDLAGPLPGACDVYYLEFDPSGESDEEKSESVVDG